MNIILRSLVIAVLLSGLPQAALSAETASAAGKRKYLIPAGPLEHVLSTFAATTGTPLSFDPTLVAGKTSPGLNGSYSTQEGFARLLENSDLELVPRAGGYTLHAQPNSASRPLKPVILAEVTVQEGNEEENAWAPVGGFVARRSATATKIDTLINETPQSISIITREQMEAQGARTVEQALRYTSGVMTEGDGYGELRQRTNIRGFRASYYLDGLKTFTAGDYSDWVAEPWALERVEVLKGPASVMYGQGEPGGIINQVSKRPSATTIREVQMLLGNHDRRQVAIDLGGKANEEGSLLYRVLGLARDSETQDFYGKDDRIFLAPALTIKATPTTTFTLMADMTRDRAMPQTSIARDYIKDAPANLYVGDPSIDRYNRDLASVAYLLEHAFGQDLVFRQTLRYSQNNLDYRNITASGASGPHTLSRSYDGIESHGHATTLDNQLQKRMTTGEWTHTLLLGFDYQRFSGTETYTFRDVADLDIHKPIYGLPLGPVDLVFGTQSKIEQSGVYLQDLIRQGRWITSLRVRRDKADFESGGDYHREQSDTKTTCQAGLLYAAANGVSPYVSYSTSFNPVTNRVYTNGGRSISIVPETGKQFELGVKYQPASRDSLITTSVFDLRKQHIDSFEGFGSTDEVRARGLELEAKASLDRQWDLIASYTYLDAESTEGFYDFSLGQQYVGTAKNTAAIWLDYRFANDTLQGWSLGGGLRYTDRIACSSIGNCFIPSHIIADAALRYARGPASLALNVTNLFDKVAPGALYYVASRTIQATLGYGW